jgi:hypothetical protein
MKPPTNRIYQRQATNERANADLILSELHLLTRVDFYSALLSLETLMPRLVHAQHPPGSG